MKERPILFSTEMVKAILDGRKTQTRRILKVKGCKPFVPDKTWEVDTIEKWNKDYHPYGKVEDLLWVRETWQYNDDLDEPYLYKQKYIDEYLPEHASIMKWKPSIFMPKEAARIWLKVTNIRVERLHDISEEDILKEGLKWEPCSTRGCDELVRGWKNYLNGEMIVSGDGKLTPKEQSFKSLWQSINGEDSWKQNPWVWVIEFEDVSQTYKPVSHAI